MRIERLIVRNFKGFANRELTFHPQFNLIVGENGTGKTSVLNALSVAIGSWLLGIPGYDTRHIRLEDVLLKGTPSESGVEWSRQFPCVVEAHGVVQNERMTWRRSLNGQGGRTTSSEARNIKVMAERLEEMAGSDLPVTLPLISYYGTGRLWDVPRDQAIIKDERDLSGVRQSRFTGYRNSVDPRLSVREMVAWFANQTWIAFQENGKESLAFKVVREALVMSIEGAHNVLFNAKMGEIIIDFGDGRFQSFNNLSDGQKCMLALVGDLAQKAATLNRHLEGEVLAKTTGVVLIDEIDLHLHPKWQRHVADDLRRIFPQIQFICTSHSPFLIQSLRSGEELIMLEGQPVAQPAGLSIEAIIQGIQGVEHTKVSARFTEMTNVARSYLTQLEEAASLSRDQLPVLREQLEKSISAYVDNPAFQALLEMKLAAKLGE